MPPVARSAIDLLAGVLERKMEKKATPGPKRNCVAGVIFGSPLGDVVIILDEPKLLYNMSVKLQEKRL